jgi:PTH1 family peptidyl-tRNA hydrolase
LPPASASTKNQPPIQLIIGLGNPGPEYEQTRHNAGFWFVDEIVRQYHSDFRNESKFSGQVSRPNVAGKDVWLLKPGTYMNLSGQAAQAMMNFYKLKPQDILVVHDELDLEPGVIRLKQGGGHGGHNGLRDLIQKLGSKEFNRLRVGIGHPGNKNQVTDYVLKRAAKEDVQKIQHGLDLAIGIIPRLLQGEFEKAMNELHSK